MANVRDRVNQYQTKINELSSGGPSERTTKDPPRPSIVLLSISAAFTSKTCRIGATIFN